MTWMKQLVFSEIALGTMTKRNDDERLTGERQALASPGKLERVSPIHDDVLLQRFLPVYSNINDLLSGPIRQFSLLFYSKNSAGMTEALKNFRKAAAFFRHQVVFVTINVDKEHFELILMYFHIWQGNVPALRFAEHDGVGFVTPFMPKADSLKTEDIKTFVEGVLNGSIKETPWFADSFNSTIHRAKMVVQENFDEVVFDKTKDVLVLFYSPWCTLCFHLTLDYDWLANRYNDREDLLIVKMDATMNELEHTDIHSFPTLRLYKKQTNEVSFHASRSCSDIGTVEAKLDGYTGSVAAAINQAALARSLTPA
ncbi:hypothetical protein HPB51_028343 [Rhipicephalus microplus]|uniref:Thioredoxin domain-containing protein n=1 Tax=Rhipicephalus microplus TaxID=6941 RepID=A0A9J6CY35_RHIMP|nr:hypothetical protein HPB51_028343 [Rhipicephalus microplus]